jgi:anti-sigma B factor antagonist
MDIKKELNGTELKISIIGKLNTVTAPQLDTEIKSSVAGITDLILDFAELDYLSSAGLRVILTAQQIMNKQGKMVIRNVNDTINEIFDVTGFIDILTIE